MLSLLNTRQALDDSVDTTSRRARRIAKKSRHAASDIGGEVRSLLNELEETLADGAGADVAILRSQLRDRLDSARTRFGDTHKAVRRRAESAWADGNQYVRDRPLQTVAAVAGLAVLVGLLLGRRQD
jgi:ElaB protein